MSDRKREVNRLTAYTAIFLSLVALLAVLSGYTQPPQSDEGTGAHIFQIAIVLLLPAIIAFLASADWQQPGRSTRPLIIPAVALILAFGALYYLENVRDPNYRHQSELIPPSNQLFSAPSASASAPPA
jgi:hypothetical protein